MSPLNNNNKSHDRSKDQLDEVRPQELVSFTHRNPNDENQDDVPDFEKNTMDWLIRRSPLISPEFPSNIPKSIFNIC